MRNLIQVALLVILTASLSSCEKIKGLFDVEFETTLSGDLDIEVQESAMKSTASHKFEKSAEVDPFANDDIAEYEDNIKDFAVDGVLVKVTYVSKKNVVFYKGTKFSIWDDEGGVDWTMENDWPIEQGTELTLEDLSKVYLEVEKILNKKKAFNVGVDGLSSETGVFITLRIGIDTKVTANPL